MPPSDDSSPHSILKSDLLNRLAINLDTAEELGPITEIWVNGRTHQITGVGCGGGLLARQSRRFLWPQVVSIGRDGVVLKVAVPTPEVEHQLQDCLPLGELELWSNHGDRVGQITDYRFERITGNILQYLFRAGESSGLEPGLYGLDPLAVVSTGRRRIMAKAEALGTTELIQAGESSSDSARLPGPFSRVPLDRLPLNRVPLNRIPDPRQGWDAAKDSTRDMRGQMGEQWQENSQKLRSEAQDRLGHLFGNVKQRTRRLRHQLRETVTDVTSGRQLGGEDIPTIDVDSMELWPEDDNSPYKTP
ncbi:MAG: PRC-barrel domain containing protein [Leptolyngbyaceae cyanobacterium SM2_3_12]|nr:PRC-barrel domain containing protein [Leptolyngbyaceae cyanobacterium SM2_3_12]